MEKVIKLTEKQYRHLKKLLDYLAPWDFDRCTRRDFSREYVAARALDNLVMRAKDNK